METVTEAHFDLSCHVNRLSLSPLQISKNKRKVVGIMILIADDDSEYNADLARILEMVGLNRYGIKTCTSCEQAIAIIQEMGQPDAMIIDMMLPLNGEDNDGGIPPGKPEELRGLRLIAEMSELGCDIRRLIAITAFRSEQAIELLHKLGIASDKIHMKPAKTSAIITSVFDVIQKQKAK